MSSMARRRLALATGSGRDVSSTVRRRLALATSAAGAMLVALDDTVLVMAQPSIRHDLVPV